MLNSVKVSKIEKVFKDKSTNKEKKICIDYAKVTDRLEAFRINHPNSKILTSYKNENNKIVFKAFLWKDFLAFEKKPEEEIYTKEFDFTPSGLEQVVDWINTTML